MNMIKWIFAACLSASCGLAHGTVTPWIDFQIVDGFVVIPTEIQGIKGHSVIDTGAQFTAIANSFVEKNELALTRSKPVTIRGVNGTQTRASYQNVPATLMGAETVFSTVIDLDLGDRPQLLIGGDFLRTLYFQFDYPNKRLRAISRDAFDLKKLSNVKSKVDKASRQPIAQVRLNDQQNVWLTIDTGNTLGVVMKRGVAAKRGWMDEYPTETLSLRGAIESAEMEKFRLPVLSIGPYNVRNASVVVPPKGAQLPMFKNPRGPWAARGKVQGLLGDVGLIHCEVTRSV